MLSCLQRFPNRILRFLQRIVTHDMRMENPGNII